MTTWIEAGFMDFVSERFRWSFLFIDIDGVADIDIDIGIDIYAVIVVWLLILHRGCFIFGRWHGRRHCHQHRQGQVFAAAVLLSGGHRHARH